LLIHTNTTSQHRDLKQYPKCVNQASSSLPAKPAEVLC